MIDEHTRLMIDTYLPHPPDPDLPEGAYYWLQYTAGMTGKPRVLTVYPLDILPYRDGIEYGIFQKKGGQLQRVDAGYGDPYRGVRMHELYDNKPDCMAQTHMMADNWRELRKIQKLETARDG